jgi:hypothetical protein
MTVIVGPVKEIAGIDLEPLLVCQDLYFTSGGRIIYCAGRLKTFPFPAEAPVMVISASIFKLLVVLSNPIADTMLCAEIEGRTLHRKNLSRRDAQRIDRNK